MISKCLHATLLLIALLAPATQAKPLKSVDLAADAGWTYRRQTGKEWSPMAFPVQIPMGEAKDGWIDFRRTVDVPKVADGQATVLRLLSIQDGGEVFVDGKSAGTVDYGLFPAELDISRLVTPGKPAQVMVRCFSRVNYYVGGHFPSDMNGRQLIGVPRGASLVIRPAVYISEIVPRPSVAKKLLGVDVYIENTSDSVRDATVHVALTPATAETCNYPKFEEWKVSLPPRTRTKVSQAVDWTMPPTSYWWPNVPFDEKYRAVLHFLNVEVMEDGKTLDTDRRRFGFVEYGEGATYYTVNGIRIFQFMDSSQEHVWSVPGKVNGFQTAYQFLPAFGTVDGAKETWRRYQRLGINTFRMHSSAGSEAMMNAADEVGMMLVGESAIRGWEKPEEEWDYHYKPAAIRGMVRWYRGRPCIARYSLDNEYNPASANPRIGAALIDAAVAEDATVPLSFSQDKPPREGIVRGTGGVGHAWIMQHYYQPKASPDTIVGVEEMYWDRNGTTRNELIGCAKSAVLDRMKGYAVFGPWNLNNYWCNFVEGGSYETGTINKSWKVKDRRDGVDGWGSDIVTFVQNCYAIYAAADVDMIENHLNTEQEIFAADKVPAFDNQPRASRELVVFNNSLMNHKLTVAWELHLDSADGKLVGQGRTAEAMLGPGEHATPTATLALPSTGGKLRKVFFVLRTLVDGEAKFEEARYFFNVTNP